MPAPSDLRIKIFADGADLGGIREAAANPLITGFTTNPTLMRKANVRDYMAFARDALVEVGGKPISFEVFAQTEEEMKRQASVLASLGANVFVKIPCVDIYGTPMTRLIGELSKDGVRVNVTAVMRMESAIAAAGILDYDAPAIISVFAGRVADTGRNPVPVMARVLELLAERPNVELLWASPREVLNVYQANEIGCHIITVTSDLLAKLDLYYNKDLHVFEMETAQMFDQDAKKAGYIIPTS
jgi:transaldolase